MINAQRQRVEQEMTTLVDNLDKESLRNMQVKSKRGSKIQSRAHFNFVYFLLFREKCICAL